MSKNLPFTLRQMKSHIKQIMSVGCTNFKTDAVGINEKYGQNILPNNLP